MQELLNPTQNKIIEEMEEQFDEHCCESNLACWIDPICRNPAKYIIRWTKCEHHSKKLWLMCEKCQSMKRTCEVCGIEGTVTVIEVL